MEHSPRIDEPSVAVDAPAPVPTAPTAPTAPGIEAADGRVVRLPFPERYVDLGAIARGGWGEVRRVRDVVVDRVVVAKVLAWEHIDSEPVLARFLNEARVTASLEHPGVVPVFDTGTLPDGRPWFAMKEVHGRTLHEILTEPTSPTDAPMRLRRLVEVLARVAETIAYAHERGIVHRDIKPGNLMVGRFGEVLVLDWGIARVVTDAADELAPTGVSDDAAATQPGQILGTCAYMSPEQARGTNVGPAADLYALGLVLREMLSGKRAREGTSLSMWASAARGELPPVVEGPSELRVLAETSTRFDPAQRSPSALGFAAALREWLDGAARLQRAELAVAHASSILPEIDDARAQRDALRAAAVAASSGVLDHEPVEKKAPIWQLEDRAADLDLRVATLEEKRIEFLRSALQHEPTYGPAHVALAATYRARMVEAERRRAPLDAARHEISLRHHDRGENAAFLRGVGRVVLDSAPTAASVIAHRWVTESRRLVLREVGVLGTTPIDVELPAGSYLLELRREGFDPVRCPVSIARDETWDATRPGAHAPQPIALLSGLDRDDVYVPGGFALVGYDELAAQPVPSGRVWVDGLLMRRFPVTCREYLDFLDSLATRGELARAWRCAPSLSRGAGAASAPAVTREGRSFVMAPDEHGREIDMDEPIVSIDWRSAMEYADWFAARTGAAWRLPSELEWEKAARGVDARAFPWGEQAEPTWACVLGSSASVPRRAPVSGHPVDESPYGVRSMAGNVREWCLNAWKRAGPSAPDGVLQLDAAALDDPSPRAIRGGAWGSTIAFARCAGRFAAKPDERFSYVGLRLCRSADQGSET